jgi:hypothetical protein
MRAGDSAVGTSELNYGVTAQEGSLNGYGMKVYTPYRKIKECLQTQFGPTFIIKTN